MNEIEINIKEIEINSNSYSLILEYYLNDIQNLKYNDDKKRLYNFFKKIYNLLKETNFLYLKNDLDTFPQKARIHLEYIQYLKFICCSKDLEEIYYKALIYELSYNINLYQYFIDLYKIIIEINENNEQNEKEFLVEKEERLKVINEIYEKIIKNKYYKGSILSKKIKFKQEKFLSLNDKNIKKINELYWYSLCSDYKTMNELFLVLTYNYQNYNGNNFEAKNLKEEIDYLIKITNSTFDTHKTKNKKIYINSNKKTLGSLISELNDILKNPKKKKKLKPDIQNRILVLENIRNISKFKNIIYGILSYKIHMCDILDEEYNIYKNSILYYKTFYSTEILDLIFRFIDIFYENKEDNKNMKDITILLKVTIDKIISSNIYHLKEDIREHDEKLLLNNKYRNKYKLIKKELIKISINHFKKNY